jgi:hypothetical protein
MFVVLRRLREVDSQTLEGGFLLTRYGPGGAGPRLDGEIWVVHVRRSLAGWRVTTVERRGVS